MKDSIVGIVLAGGKSTRIGQDKKKLRINDQTFVEHAINVLKPVVSEVYISGEPESNYGHKSFPDIIPDIGPIGGLYSALKQIESDYFLFIPVDLPYLRPEHLHELTKHISGKNEIIAAESDFGIEPLVAIYKKSVLSIIEANIQKKQYSIFNVIKKLKTKIVKYDTTVFGTNTFFNVNYGTDYEKLLKRRKNG